MTDLARIGWYVRRLGRMSPGEVAWRLREQALRRGWARRQVLPGHVPDGPVRGALRSPARRFTSVLPPDAAALVPAAAREAIIADADRILKGEWELLSVVRRDMDAPDWFLDPVTGRRSDRGRYAFRINQRSEEQVGNIKQVWEVNRLQHLTLLAVAWYLTGDDVYAQRVDSQLRDWWEANPFLSGVNWTSGIELGIRLINFAWIRRLLAGWPGVADLFEANDLAVRQIRWHQEYLRAFESRGSSANNHLVAEAAGLLAASCAFPWFAESARWRTWSSALLERSLRSNTFGSGINRELASDYHGFVFELGIFAAIEASLAGCPVREDTWQLLCAMADCMAALVDSRSQPPRQGDSDEGRVVLLGAPSHNRWPELLAIGDAAFGRLDWWPEVSPHAGSAIVGALTGTSRAVAGRPVLRPSRFEDAGLTILRTGQDGSPEIWCRCDGGPHGFLSIAAHAHADALSVEVRYGGVDILADAGTYCYHGEPAWRSYFRSTIAHNTVELGGRNQSADGGPFLWLRQARAREIEVVDDGTAVRWTAEHDGYLSLRPPARHRRSVRLDRAARGIGITDVISGGGHEICLAFHFGPDVHVELEDSGAKLSWGAASEPGTARMELPAGLRWQLHHGEPDPVLGWYSPGLGRRIPAFTLLGRGRSVAGKPLATRLVFQELVKSDEARVPGRAVSLIAPDAAPAQALGSQAEAR
jgi:Heparinase II/III-like protein/Heparinase II/III N-terminus